MALPLILIAISIILMIISILFEWEFKVKNIRLKTYWVFPVICAFILVAFGFIGQKNLESLFFSNSEMNPTRIIAIFFSFSGLSILIDELGFFKFLAQKIVKKYKRNQTTLFVSFSILVAILTIFTSNDILILTLTPFICHFAKHAKINPIPYVITEFVMANVWSMFFFIGNPTNIYVSTVFKISFCEYTSTMFLPTIFAGITAFSLTFLTFKKHLKKRLENPDEKPIKLANFPLIVSLISLITAIIFVAFSQPLNIPVWFAPLICCFSAYSIVFFYLLIKRKSFKTLTASIKKLPLEIIPFLLSMSILVEALKTSGVIERLAQVLQNSDIFTFGILAFLSGNIFNNIPMTMLFTNLLSFIGAPGKLAYSLIVASNICAFLTPIGALAGIMFINILKHNGIKFSFKRFFIYGAIISLPTLFVSLLVLYLI